MNLKRLGRVLADTIILAPLVVGLLAVQAYRDEPRAEPTVSACEGVAVPKQAVPLHYWRVRSACIRPAPIRPA